nr:trypsin delta-like [Drosophila takahashii]
MLFQGFHLLLAIFLLSLPRVPGIFEPTDRIIGGSKVAITEVPWQVSLQYNGQHFCGGSIYSETIIITAAHCVEDKMTLPLDIRAGSSDYQNGGTLVQVEAIRYHAEYKRLANDVAVLKLRYPLTFSDAIQPISLAEKNPAEGSVALTTGWGSVGLINDTPQELRGVQVKIENWLWCRIKYFFVMYSDDICAGSAFQAICRGDSGGPLVVDGKLVGITSRTGNFLCLASGLYASVAKYNTWIHQAIESF